MTWPRSEAVALGCGVFSGFTNPCGQLSLRLALFASTMNVMFALFNLGGGEIILILALVLILFGAKKLPELAKGLGQGIKEFKKATREVTDEVTASMNEPPSPPPPARLPSSSSSPEPASTVAQQPAPGTRA